MHTDFITTEKLLKIILACIEKTERLSSNVNAMLKKQSCRPMNSAPHKKWFRLLPPCSLISTSHSHRHSHRSRKPATFQNRLNCEVFTLHLSVCSVYYILDLIVGIMNIKKYLYVRWTFIVSQEKRNNHSHYETAETIIFLCSLWEQNYPPNAVTLHSDMYNVYPLQWHV